METKEMREQWQQCKDSYNEAPFMVRSQLKPFMEPMLALLWALINQADGSKGQSCCVGSDCTCTGHGLRDVMTNQEVQAHVSAVGEQANPLLHGSLQRSSAQDFPPIEG